MKAVGGRRETTGRGGCVKEVGFKPRMKERELQISRLTKQKRKK